ncbi:hypothetical protein QQ045_017948 [Rhodiola kirilowii]
MGRVGRGLSTCLWLIIGDFNTIASWNENKGGKKNNGKIIRLFNDFMANVGVSDAGYEGPTFTWSNNQDGASRIWERLDKCLVNGLAMNKFPTLKILHLSRVASDHCPLLLQFDDGDARSRRSFNIMGMWTEHHEFLSKVSEACEGREHINPLEWNLMSFGDINKKIKEANVQLLALDNILQNGWDEEIRSRIKEVNQNLSELLRYQCDRNSGFFHAAIKARRAQNSIRLTMEDGTPSDDGDFIGVKAYQYFEQLFGEFSAAGDINLGNLLKPLISDEENAMLTTSPDLEEIKHNVFNMKSDSSPGPDGFTGKNISNCWYSVMWKGNSYGFFKSNRGVRQGEKLNPTKSKIFFYKLIGIDRRKQILKNTKFHEGTFPTKYLGAPLFLGRPRTVYFKHLEDKIRSRIMGWAKSFLNISGRATLITSVLSSLSVYTISIIPVPVTCIKSMERLFANFLWDGKDHWISWTTICLPKKEGGLGIKTLKGVKEAMLAKVAWKFLKNDSLWAKFCREKYMNKSKKSALWSATLPQIKRLRRETYWAIGRGTLLANHLCEWLDFIPPKISTCWTIKDLNTIQGKRNSFLEWCPMMINGILPKIQLSDFLDRLFWRVPSNGFSPVVRLEPGKESSLVVRRFPRKILIFPQLIRQHPRLISTSGCVKPYQMCNLDGEVDRVNSITDGSDELEIENCDMLLETCTVRSLPPVLSIEDGLEKISEELEKLKINPPCSSSGILRFQVAVPPSPKALNWFCCQPESSSVFPQFFLSKDRHSNHLKFESAFNGTRGVFGVGAAFYCRHSSNSLPTDWNSFKRYLIPGSSLLISYGFLNLETDMCSTKLKTGSFYLFVPQVELDEQQNMSILAATLAWNNSSLCTFGVAISSLELSLHQVSRTCCSISPLPSSKGLISLLKSCNIVNDSSVSMVEMKARFPGGKDVGADPTELKKDLSLSQYIAKISPKFSISSNMRNYATEGNFSIQSLPNINAVWAWLIIEECTRLGLTYFCIAPGSRSSPLAVAASTHPLASCVACFDERSLAFHAVGYARGSHRSAVVITTSGTAVSNLLPAVVEAAQDFVPLLLLTADRPPELQSTGANQSINQVNHFGSFTRSFFNLPTPTDEIQARMVLTTVDSAVNLATTSPFGPVHINCPFREPLDHSPSNWSYSSLKGLNFWISSAEPLTKYIQLQHLCLSIDSHGQLSDVIQVLQRAKRGLLLIGALRTEDEMWAALLLAKHLSWPVVPDVLSGFRLRKKLGQLSETESKVFFLDYLDHMLLSDPLRCWAQADVILQIGSRLTSKRVSQMLEGCFPMSYVMVDGNPCRHDPLHIVTHRVQSTITEFVACMLKAQFPSLGSEWISTLHTLNIMVGNEISFQIRSDPSLREPFIAYAISKAISSETALFIGNSMAIRDADMYGHSGVNSSGTITMLDLGIPCQGIIIGGNRGASGIDGLLSTAIGFAVGCQRRVVCLLGDVSFLHDTNGLAILNQRVRRKPLTIVVINNHGGAIFRLLPISNNVDTKIMDQFFYTSHNVSISNLCLAHGVKYLKVKTKPELLGAIFTSKGEDVDLLIEVESWIDDNANFHSGLRNSACETADNVLTVLLKTYPSDSIHYTLSSFKIHKMEFSLFRISLNESPTSDTLISDPTMYQREGFIATIYLEDGSVGHGEVSPLDIHKENLVDIEGQLCYLSHVLKGVEISYALPLMKGSFSTWIWSNLGLPPHSIFPSVRCGLEMAILNALAAKSDSSLFELLYPRKETRKDSYEGSLSIKVCGLIDSVGSPTRIAHAAHLLVEEGFSAIKLKVARRSDPLEDAEVINEVRNKVGSKIVIRADANRKWSYEEAVQFAHSVKNYNLQFLEEPVQFDGDILRFCEETGLAVALDETLNSIQGDLIDYLAKFNHPGIASVVIKPSVVGGFENAALIAKWAQQQGKTAVISSAFESSVGLAAFVQFASYINCQHLDIRRVTNRETNSSVAHGLGTYKWLKEDVTTQALIINRKPDTGIVEAYVADADELMKNFQINTNVVLRRSNEMPVRTYLLDLESASSSCSVKVQEMGPIESNNVVVFIHGFLGTSDDWIDIMKATSGSSRCISLDIPGHGSSKIRNHEAEEWQECGLKMEIVAAFLRKLIGDVTPHKVTLVGYSMGARIALYMSLKFANKVDGAVIISGSPGLKDESSKKIRRRIDDSRARSLIGNGLEVFLDNWYAQELWER